MTSHGYINWQFRFFVLINGLPLLGAVVLSLARQAKRLNHAGRAAPINAEFLFYLFLDAQNCDAIVGDLEERYRIIGRKFGKRRADFWYWTQAIRSVGPIAWAALQRLVKGVSGIAALLELYRKIRS